MTPGHGHAPTLSRDDLEQDRMRVLYAEIGGPGHTLNDDELAASLAETLAAKPKGAGWWVFAYGSLLWNPLFPVAEMRPARLTGWHRRFCLWSLASRGTPQLPGLVLGLEPGGACRGVAMRLPTGEAVDELQLLWRREMVVRVYRARWVRVDTGGRVVNALTFTVRHDHLQYAGKLPLARQAAVVARARGVFGSSLDYLERTRVALVSHGIVDFYLEDLARRVLRERGQAEPSPPQPAIARAPRAARRRR
jgi:cation transport protein ChaC